MSYSDCYYFNVGSDQFDDIEGWGFVEGNKSDDKTRMIITKNDQEDISHLITASSKPSWVPGANWIGPLTEKEVKDMIAVEMTDGTIATGWWKKIP